MIALPILLAATPVGPALRALRWTDQEKALDALTSMPPECLQVSDDPQVRKAIEIGRAAFRTPIILGGQAARLGLSCESCHTNGRKNSAFVFPGLSGPSGTADVTNALMSTHRDNGNFDPVPIPDLAQAGKEDRNPNRLDLRNFIRGLIVDEFDGHEPPPAVLDGLTAYVRHLNSDACSNASPSSMAEAWIDAAARAAAAAQERLVAGDRPSALVMVAAARSALGNLDERFIVLPTAHALLMQQDQKLSAIKTGIERGRKGTDARIDRWIKTAPSWKKILLQAEPHSRFGRDVLAREIG